MDTAGFIKLVASKITYFIMIPVIIGAVMYLLTMNQPKKYSAQAVIFTGITSSSSIEDMEKRNVDYFATQNAYNNVLTILNSRSVLEETSLRLLTKHLMIESPAPGLITVRAFNALGEIVPKEVRSLVVPEDFEASYENIKAYIAQDENNFIYGLLNYEHPVYSIKALSAISASRLQSSDLVQITYENADPAICYQTLKILTEVFIERYNQLQKTQTSSIVAYFEEQLKNASNKLKASEDKLLIFNTRNDIINYYEQTKHISSQEEKIEVKLQDMKLEFDAANSVLKRLENEINNRFSLNLHNTSILSLRRQLVKINDLIAYELLNEEKQPGEKLTILQEKKIRLESELQQCIDTMYVHENRSEGIEQEKILSEWLDAVKESESSRARYEAMQLRKIEFMKRYQQYAPLGATLKRIEREIDVNEREYLEILHHLGLAQLKQQNADLMSDMKVLDEPKLPINPLPSKRKIYVLVFAFAGTLFYLFGLFILELFDQRVRTPERMEKMTGLPVVSVLVEEDVQNTDTGAMNARAANYLLEAIGMNYDETSSEVIRVNVLSNWANEHISDVTRAIGTKLSGYTVQQTPQEEAPVTGAAHKDDPVGGMPVEKAFTFSYRGNTIVLREIPPLSEGITDAGVIVDAEIQLFVVHARRVWSKADEISLRKLQQLAPGTIKTVLTRALPSDLENFYGEIPKKRSWVRRFIKLKLLKRFI